MVLWLNFKIAQGSRLLLNVQFQTDDVIDLETIQPWSEVVVTCISNLTDVFLHSRVVKNGTTWGNSQPKLEKTHPEKNSYIFTKNLTLNKPFILS